MNSETKVNNSLKTLADDYNARINKFVKYKLKDIEATTFTEGTDTRETEVDIAMKDGEVITQKITRYNLSDLVNADDSNYAATSVVDLFEVSKHHPLGMVGLQRDIAKACNMNDVDSERLGKGFEITLLLWGSYGVFVPPEDITSTDITYTDEVIEYVGTLDYEVAEVHRVIAREDSFGYVGEVNVIIKKEGIVTIPTIENNSPDVSEVTNCGIPGVWFVYVNYDPNLEENEDSNLYYINTAIDNAFYKIGIYDSGQSYLKEQTLVDGGIDIRVYPPNGGVASSFVGEFTVQLRTTTPLDISTIVNTPEGVLNYYSFKPVTGLTPSDLMWDISNLMRGTSPAVGGSHNDSVRDINYSKFKVEEYLDDPTIPEGVKAFKLSRGDTQTEYQVTGELIVHAHYIPGDYTDFRPVHLNYNSAVRAHAGAFDIKYTHNVPSNFNAQTEVDIIIDNMVKAVAINPNHTLFKQYRAVTADEFECVIDEDGLGVTIQGKLEARVSRVVGKIHIDFVVNDEEVSVPRILYPILYVGSDISFANRAWELHLNDYVNINSNPDALIMPFVTYMNANYPDINLTKNELIVRPRESYIEVGYDTLYGSSKFIGAHDLSIVYPEVDLSVVTNCDKPGVWLKYTANAEDLTEQEMGKALAAELREIYTLYPTLKGPKCFETSDSVVSNVMTLVNDSHGNAATNRLYIQITDVENEVLEDNLRFKTGIRKVEQIIFPEEDLIELKSSIVRALGEYTVDANEVLVVMDEYLTEITVSFVDPVVNSQVSYPGEFKIRVQRAYNSPYSDTYGVTLDQCYNRMSTKKWHINADPQRTIEEQAEELVYQYKLTVLQHTYVGDDFDTIFKYDVIDNEILVTMNMEHPYVRGQITLVPEFK